MHVTELEIAGVKLVSPKKYSDERGFFTELYSIDGFAKAGIVANFVQDNLSVSISAGTIRGLHFQRPPREQAKLVRVMFGRILDVALDCRRDSPTFGGHISIELSAGSGDQLFLPPGIAHGFCTLEPNTTVQYKVDNYYAPDSDGGVIWSDPLLRIEWPVNAASAIVSDKDRHLPSFSEIGNVFI